MKYSLKSQIENSTSFICFFLWTGSSTTSKGKYVLKQKKVVRNGKYNTNLDKNILKEKIQTVVTDFCFRKTQ